MIAIEPIGPQVRIRDVRLAHGLTLGDTAERISDLGVSVDPASLSNIERGHRKGSRKLLAAWARALGLQPLDVWQPDDVDEPED